MQDINMSQEPPLSSQSCHVFYRRWGCLSL